MLKIKKGNQKANSPENNKLNEILEWTKKHHASYQDSCGVELSPKFFQKQGGTTVP